MADTSEDLLDFSRYLKKLRLESGLSQEALAELIGTSNTTICRYETGRQTPTRYHRARLAEVFGVPGYSLYEDDYISSAYMPDVLIKTQERVRHAMLSDDFEYVDELIYKLHISTNETIKRLSIQQAKNFLRCWSFFHQGASAKSTLDDLLCCIRLTRPDFSLSDICDDTTPRTPLSYAERGIINFMGVVLSHTGDYMSAAKLFNILIRQTDDVMLASERRYFQKCVFGLNLTLSLRRLGRMQHARALLKLYCRDAYLYGSPALCIRLLIGSYRCLDENSAAYQKERRQAGSSPASASQKASQPWSTR